MATSAKKRTVFHLNVGSEQLTGRGSIRGDKHFDEDPAYDEAHVKRTNYANGPKTLTIQKRHISE